MTSKKQKKSSLNSSAESNNFIQIGPNPPKGWQCPICFSVWAPWVDRCENCFSKSTITYSTDGTWEVSNV